MHVPSNCDDRVSRKFFTFTNRDRYLDIWLDLTFRRTQNEKEMVYVTIGSLMVIIGGVMLGLLK